MPTDTETNGLCSGKKTIGSLIGSPSLLPEALSPPPRDSNTYLLTHSVFPLSPQTANF